MKIGDVVEGRYRILKTLGQGGMGSVFLAEHALIKRKVAIKILHPDLATDADVIERFMNEARAAGTLGHPNIVESTDMGFTGNHVPYIVFEYLEGTLLTDEVYRVGGLPVRRAIRIADQITSALAAAHNAGIVHRDLKSDNIFLTDKDDALDHVKVLDFGISRFLEIEDRQRSMVMGTPEFMAPEQITAPESVDKRADIYALGVIMYEMLTARRPFSNEDDPRQLLHRIVNYPPPPLMRPEVPHGLQQIVIEKLLAKSPGERFQSMADVQAALEQFFTHDTAPRRRTAPVALTSADDIARDSALIPRPSNVLDTPLPGSIATLGNATTGVGHVALPHAMPAKKPYPLYAMAGASVLVGVLGLSFGLRGSKHEQAAMTPPPAPVQPLPAAAAPVVKAQPKIAVELDADAPNAHVVFRRRIATAPTTMQINSTDVVELVEVSAPGYKTQRYWLTFDRPTHLKAHLVKGTGLTEASEEETLVALGEVAAPAIAAAAPQAAMATVARVPVAATSTQVAAAMPAAHATGAVTTGAVTTAAATTGAVTTGAVTTGAVTTGAVTTGAVTTGSVTTGSVTTPGVTTRVGMTSAITASAMSPMTSATGATAASPTSAMSPTTSTPPTMATAPTTTAAMAPMAPRKIGRAAAEAAPAPAELPAIAATEPTLPTTAEPAPAAVATTELPAPKPADEPKAALVPEPVRPVIDNATVSSVVGAHRPEVLKCFAEGKKKDHAMKGTLAVQLAVDATGKVKHIQVQSTVNNPLVAACVVKSASAWRFPARNGADMATVNYPFTIN